MGERAWAELGKSGIWRGIRQATLGPLRVRTGRQPKGELGTSAFPLRVRAGDPVQGLGRMLTDLPR